MALYFQDKFTWAAQLSASSDYSIRYVLNLLDQYEDGTVDRRELDKFEASIAKCGFHFADSIEDLPGLPGQYDVVDEGDSCD